ncbi:MAG: hypothetical protein Salg2KO_21930 [Salibacteraceae bacterium]
MVNAFIRNSIGLIVLLFSCALLQGQESDLFKSWPDTTLAKANSAKDVDYMSQEEKQVVFYTNLCRINPSVFSDTYLKEYLKENDIKRDKVVRGLIQDLESAEPRKILQPSDILTQAARKHAKDMGETGRTGHNASDGSGFRDRMLEVSKSFNGLNENANYGNEKGIDIVMDLLIDRNVPTAGHRKNILDWESRYIGVAIEPHKRYGFNCVQDFGGTKKN